MARVLVTGVAGFIGYHVASRLLERGDAVVAVCRTTSATLDALADQAEGRLTIEAGVDVLNPVQPECMNFAEIHAEWETDPSKPTLS